jgi:hypothetical protein
MADAYSSVEFRDVPGFPGYRVGSDGSVWSCWEKIRLKKGRGFESVLGEVWRKRHPTPNGRGYLALPLRRKGRTFTKPVHALVLLTFVGPKPSGAECRHLDGKRQNNRLTNLVWGTHAENEADKRLHGGVLRGEENGNAILTVERVRRIKALLREGRSQVAVARLVGISRPTVGAIARGRMWRHVQ